MTRIAEGVLVKIKKIDYLSLEKVKILKDEQKGTKHACLWVGCLHRSSPCRAGASSIETLVQP